MFIGPWGSALGSALQPGSWGASLGVRLGSGWGQLSVISWICGPLGTEVQGWLPGWVGTQGGVPVLDPLEAKLEGSPLPCAGCQICMENWEFVHPPAAGVHELLAPQLP